MNKNKTSLQDTLNELSGYLIKIEINLEEDDFLPIFEIIFPAKWLIAEQQDFIVEKIPLSQGATRYKIWLQNKELGADSIVTYITKLISYNEEIETKQEELLELQRRREVELLAEIEKIKNNFLNDTVSVPHNFENKEDLAERIFNGRNKKKANDQAVSSAISFPFEKEVDEDDSDIVETL